jgi:hypothetical protein
MTEDIAYIGTFCKTCGGKLEFEYLSNTSPPGGCWVHVDGKNCGNTRPVKARPIMG